MSVLYFFSRVPLPIHRDLDRYGTFFQKNFYFSKIRLIPGKSGNVAPSITNFLNKNQLFFEKGLRTPHPHDMIVLVDMEDIQQQQLNHMGS
ncbi:hypothetical protein KB236_09840 [Levilactobacillus brevis]|nr:hypothetical protein KB236_09840 [Levilactobacillus brevis]